MRRDEGGMNVMDRDQDTNTDKFFESSYERGATEQQDIQAFQDEPDGVFFYEVRPVERTVIDYVRVK